MNNTDNIFPQIPTRITYFFINYTSRVKKSIKSNQIDFPRGHFHQCDCGVLLNRLFYIIEYRIVYHCDWFRLSLYVSVGCTPRESVLTEPIERNASASAIGSVTIGRGCHLLILNENSLSNWPWAAFLSVLLNDDSCLKRAVCNGTNSMTVHCGHGDCKVFPLMPVNGSTAMEFYAAYEHDFLPRLSKVINTAHGKRGKV